MIQSLNHLSQAIYRQYGCVSQSDLKKCYDNPQLYHEIATGKRASERSSDSQDWGTAFETYVRTESLDYVPIPAECLDKNGNRNGSSSAWKLFKLDNGDKLLLTPREAEQWHADMDDALRNLKQHDVARELIYSESATWHQRFQFEGPHGLDMKCEMDIFDQERFRVVDLKTAADVDPRSFERDIFKWGYDIQAACYLLAAEMWHAAEDASWGYYWVVVRNVAPFNVEVYEASDMLLEVGLSRLMERIEFYQHCVRSKRWVSPTHGGSVMVYPPEWIKEICDANQ